MKKNGTLVHKSKSPDGDVEIIDNGSIRSLYLGSDAVQSAMNLNDPVSLQLSYTRAMMSFLLLINQPQRILIVGLGGGSVLRFLQYHFPSCHLDVIEQRDDVIALAKTYFSIHPSDKLTIYTGDAEQILKQKPFACEFRYDAILLDAYDGQGLSPSLVSIDFYDRCRSLLSGNGITIANLWANQIEIYQQALNYLRHSYDEQLLQLPVFGKGNVIILACNKTTPFKQLKRNMNIAKTLELKCDIKFCRILRDLQCSNKKRFWQRLANIYS